MKRMDVLLLSVILLHLVGCEGYIYINACVRNISSDEPISNAILYIKYANGETTDTLNVAESGCVEHNLLVGCVPKCPDYSVVVSALNFDTREFQGNIFDFPIDTPRVFHLNKRK